MSAPFDLTDALKTHSPSGNRLGPRAGGPGPRSRSAVWLEEAARALFKGTLVACTALLVYLAYGLYSGAWSDPVWNGVAGGQQHAYHVQQLANAGLALNLLHAALIILVMSLAVGFWGMEGLGLMLLGAAAILAYGIPLLTGPLYNLLGLTPTSAPREVLRGLQVAGLLVGVPGLALLGVDTARYLQATAEAARVRAVNRRYSSHLRYSSGPGGHAHSLEHPSSMLNPASSISHPMRRSLESTGKPRLNLLQRQNRAYYGGALGVLAANVLLVLLNLAPLEVWVGHLMAWVEALTDRFSMASAPTGIAALHDDGRGIIIWSVLVVLDVVAFSQVLRLLEYICYRRQK